MHVFKPVIEIYITNVCNLTCRGCNRFNNYNFKGHHRWEDSADALEAWSKRITSPKITIIGGEPTLHPELETWAMNVRRLWPDADILVQTNGTYFRPHFVTFWEKYKVGFVISLHDKSTATEIVNTWLSNDMTTYNIDAFVFRQAAVIQNNNHFTLHESEPSSAFVSCDMKHDHTLVDGKLYKCPTMSTLPAFINQFDVQLSERQQELLNAYQPLSADCSEEELLEFVNSIDKPIKQCEFCPANLKWYFAQGDDDSEQPIPVF